METGLSVHAEVVDVHDGDTVTVELKFRVPVRIRDLWAPELKEPGGLQSRDALKMWLPVGSKCVVFVPSKNPLLLMDCVSLGRMVGDVYTADGVKVSDLMIGAGLGTPKKEHK